jgi:hypothetical protein
MDRDELQYHEAATRQGLSLHRSGNDSWSLGPPPSIEPLSPSRRVEPSLTFVSENRVRLADGRIFKRAMTTAELRVALGIDGSGS